jgi:hypothetical protein
MEAERERKAGSDAQKGGRIVPAQYFSKWNALAAAS